MPHSNLFPVFIVLLQFLVRVHGAFSRSGSVVSAVDPEAPPPITAAPEDPSSRIAWGEAAEVPYFGVTYIEIDMGGDKVRPLCCGGCLPAAAGRHGRSLFHASYVYAFQR